MADKVAEKKVPVMVEDKILSPRFSLKGWNFKDWLLGNWTTILELAKVGAPLILGIEFFRNNPAMVGVVTVLGKLLLDTIHYWASEKTE